VNDSHQFPSSLSIRNEKGFESIENEQKREKQIFFFFLSTSRSNKSTLAAIPIGTLSLFLSLLPLLYNLAVLGGVLDEHRRVFFLFLLFSRRLNRRRPGKTALVSIVGVFIRILDHGFDDDDVFDFSGEFRDARERGF